MNKSRLSIILCLLMMTIGATAKLLPGPIGRIYDTGPEIPTPPNISLYGDYLFYASALSVEPCFDFETILRISPDGTYTTFPTNWKLKGYSYDMNGYGKWEISNDTILFYELYPLYYDYYTYFPESREFLDSIGLYKEEGLHMRARELARVISDTLIINTKTYPDNVSVATIKDFGNELEFITDFCSYRPPYERGTNPAYYVPSDILYKKSDISVKTIKAARRKDEEQTDSIKEAIPVCRFLGSTHLVRVETSTQFYPWMLQEHDWQSGCFKVLTVKQAWQSNERVATILEKDGLRFTVVNPRYYLPGSGLRLYDKADEEALSVWMDTVQVGRSYEFELMRPAYPADSIADFLPLRTIPGSIYAAEGEAYGYFFGHLKSR